MTRRATIEDIPALLAMAQAMHGESPIYQKIPFFPADMRAFLLHKLEEESDTSRIFVAENSAGICGMIGGMLQVYMYNFKDFSACDFGFYVRPEARGGRHFFRLLQAYEDWARAVGAWPIRLAESSMINSVKVDAILQKRGYIKAGMSYMLDDNFLARRDDAPVP